MDSVLKLSSDNGLQQTYQGMLNACMKVSEILRFQTSDKQVDSTNKFGDVQLDSDVECDQLIFNELKNTGVVAYALSEENPQPVELGGNQTIVTFDPIDGSSIIGSNWSVGTIFGVFRHIDSTQKEEVLIGRSGNELIGAGLCLYGPRTTILLFNQQQQCVQEYSIKLQNGQQVWKLTKDKITIKDKTNVFAPANLRCVNSSPAYKNIVDYWITNNYTLRYTGGMVPDVYQIFIKGHGVFSNLVSEGAPPKLRYLYEALPLAYLIEKADGKSSDGVNNTILDTVIESWTQKCGICVGSKSEIERIQQFIQQ